MTTQRSNMVEVRIPVAWRSHTEGCSAVELTAASVQDTLDQLVQTHIGLRLHLFLDNGTPRETTNIYLNEVHIRYLQGYETPVSNGDLIAIVPSIAERNNDLTHEERARYRRHVSLPQIGIKGQQRLKQSSVLCIGAGGLGSPTSIYLAAAGVGRIGIVDADGVDVSNLQRQILHRTSDVGRRKVDSAREQLMGINPHTQVDAHPVRITSMNALELIQPYDIVIDGSDNFPTRYLVNDACVLLGKPNIYGSIFQFEGQASLFWASKGPCYRCLFPTPPPPGQTQNCAEGGVLGVLPGLIGIIQATEAVKLILEAGDSLIGRLLIVDTLRMGFRELKIPRDPACPICGENPTITELIDDNPFCEILPDSPTSSSSPVCQITATELKAEIDRDADLFLIDVRQPFEYELCRIDNALLIPLDELQIRMEKLDPTRNTIVYCHSGIRSVYATKVLQNAGFNRVRNLTGGIQAWADEVDPTLPRY